MTETDDDDAIDLRSTSNRVEITVELPDCTRDDIRVSVGGAELRLWAEADEEFDRTITLADPVRDGDVDVRYDDPTLTVTVRKQARR